MSVPPGSGPTAFDPTGLSDREFLALVRARPGMYTGRSTLDRIVVYLYGYDSRARRSGESVLHGFGAWLEERGTPGNNLGWPDQVRRIALRETGSRALGQLTPEEDGIAITVLFQLLDEFLAEREG
ncbi:hypothetical protein [Nocardiopsis ganjiahuensis]|uniref:hypothetical protein n=1 Tax=Nocardiopsis ganjiahuensis TaxID=239984 RepID=UPI000348E00C|nr:hypothetical protein [Nocardiopsis ganjiahuensis]